MEYAVVSMTEKFLIILKVFYFYNNEIKFILLWLILITMVSS